MILSRFKEYRRGAGGVEELARYLTTDLTTSMRNLFEGLKQLTFAKNFSSFEATVSILAGEELRINNRLGVIPSKRIIVRSNSHEIIDGPTPWTVESVYLKNDGASAADVTVIFLV